VCFLVMLVSPARGVDIEFRNRVHSETGRVFTDPVKVFAPEDVTFNGCVFEKGVVFQDFVDSRVATTTGPFRVTMEGCVVKPASITAASAAVSFTASYTLPDASSGLALAFVNNTFVDADVAIEPNRAVQSTYANVLSLNITFTDNRFIRTTARNERTALLRISATVALATTNVTLYRNSFTSPPGDGFEFAMVQLAIDARTTSAGSSTYALSGASHQTLVDSNEFTVADPTDDVQRLDAWYALVV
jgi:hypothetical protein